MSMEETLLLELNFCSYEPVRLIDYSKASIMSMTDCTCICKELLDSPTSHWKNANQLRLDLIGMEILLLNEQCRVSKRSRMVILLFFAVEEISGGSKK